MGARWEHLSTVAVIIAAGAITTSTLRREFFRSAPPVASEAPPPRYVREWREYQKSGQTNGSLTAPVQLLVLADFECPFCARMEFAIQDLKARMGTQVTTTFIHHPLPGHRFAEPAARVAECAARQGRFGSMRDALYAKQDSLVLKSLESYAVDAYVPDITNFLSCVAERGVLNRVEAGLELGKKLGIRGTPTLLINGWLYYGLQPRDLEKEVMKRRVPS